MIRFTVEGSVIYPSVCSWTSISRKISQRPLVPLERRGNVKNPKFGETIENDSLTCRQHIIAKILDFIQGIRQFQTWNVAEENDES